MVPLELRGRTQVRDEAVELLERVGLGERLTPLSAATFPAGNNSGWRWLGRSSTGQKFFFADEPTGNLDAETGSVVIERMFALNADLGTTLVLVTHDTELARRTQRIIRLKGGVVVE